ERHLTPDEKLDQKLDAQISDEAIAPPAEKKGRSFALPVVFGLLGVGAGVSGAVVGMQAKSHEARFRNLDTPYYDAQAIGAQARTEALVTNILFAGAGVLLLGTLITLIAG